MGRLAELSADDDALEEGRPPGGRERFRLSRLAEPREVALSKQGRSSPWDDEATATDCGETDPFSADATGLPVLDRDVPDGIRTGTIGCWTNAR